MAGRAVVHPAGDAAAAWREEQRGGTEPRMPRLLHLSDVHLGARHDDLGPAATQQRERQWAAFARAVDVGVAERVDVVLVCGDLFDSNRQPRRSVERAVGELARLLARGIRVVLIPGTHDAYEPGSIYRVFDLAAMAGLAPGVDDLVVLTDTRRSVTYADLAVTVHGFVGATKTLAASPLADFTAVVGPGADWQVGMIHGSLLVPGLVEHDDVLFTAEEVAASGLDYLALGHWHSHRQGRAGRTVWAYSGAPEPVAVDQDGAGHVLIVTLEGRGAERSVEVERRPVGRTRIERLDVGMSDVASQDELVRRIAERADPDLVLDVRLAGVLPSDLDLDLDEVEHRLAGAFLRLRLRDASIPAPPEVAPPPPGSVEGAFVRDLEQRIRSAQEAGLPETAAEQAEALRLGRLLLDDPARVTLA